jgi:hypothetical protein
MNSAFNWVMRRAPQLLSVAAILIYLSTVITALAAGNEMQTALGEQLPMVLKLRALALIFVQPLELPLVLFASGAALWRWDRSFTSQEQRP